MLSFDLVSVADLEGLPPREPTIAELSQNLTVAQGKMMLRRIGMINTGNSTKDVKFSVFIRDWAKIQERALEYGVVDRPQTGKVKLMGFANDNGNHSYLLTSGEVFTLDYLKSLAPNPCNRDMVMTLTYNEMKTFIYGLGWTGASFKGKDDIAGYVLSEFNDAYIATIEVASSDNETSESEDDCKLDEDAIDQIIDMVTDAEDFNFLVDPSDFYDDVKYAHIQDVFNRGLFTVKYDGKNTTVSSLKNIIATKIASIADPTVAFIKSGDFRLVSGLQAMNEEDLVSNYARGAEMIYVGIRLKIKGGGKSVKKETKVAVSKANIAESVKKLTKTVPPSNDLIARCGQKLQSLMALDTENYLSMTVAKMNVRDIDAIIEATEDFKQKMSESEFNKMIHIFSPSSRRLLTPKR